MLQQRPPLIPAAFVIGRNRDKGSAQRMLALCYKARAKDE